VLRRRATLAALTGPGEIVAIQLAARPSVSRLWRSVRIVMRFDGGEHPSVEVPIGDFFGIAFGTTIDLQAVGQQGPWRTVRWPMPFLHSAQLELVHDAPDDLPLPFDCRVHWQPRPAWTTAPGYFHCRFAHELTRRGEPFVVLEVSGQKGQFVGGFFTMQGTVDLGLAFLEGDERILVDGDSAPPAFRGTGTEDYFGGAWYFRGGEFNRPFHGLSLLDGQHLRVAVARHHIADPIPFARSLRFELEHGAANDTPGCTYTATTCFYSDRPSGDGSRLPPPPLRAEPAAIWTGLFEAELLPGAGAHGVFDSPLELQLGNGAFLRLPPTQSHALYLDAPTAGPYMLHARLLGSESSAPWRLRLGGLQVELLPPTRGELGPWQALGQVQLRSDRNALVLEPTGNPGPLQIDALRLAPYREFLRDWWLVGPFPSSERSGFEAPFGPELEALRHDQDYPVVGDGSRRPFLTPLPGSASGFVDLNALVAPNDRVVVYAVCRLRVAKDLESRLLLGSDDGCKVFLDRKQVYQHRVLRGALPDQDRVPLHLTAGDHELVLKIEEIDGGFGFFARFEENRGIEVLPNR
jgi:hypothetical protein